VQGSPQQGNSAGTVVESHPSVGYPRLEGRWGQDVPDEGTGKEVEFLGGRRWLRVQRAW